VPATERRDRGTTSITSLAPGKFLDLQMLIFPGGRERTEKEFRELLASSGWRLTRVIPTAAGDSIVEAATA